MTILSSSRLRLLRANRRVSLLRIKSLRPSWPRLDLYTLGNSSSLTLLSFANLPRDITITKSGNNIFFDKRHDSNLELLTVNENSSEPPAEAEKDTVNINSAPNLALETTNVEFAAKKIATDETDEATSFESTDISGDQCAYRYRQWNLGDNTLLIARLRVDSALPNAQDQYANIHTFFEYDPRVSAMPYRQKLDAQKGAVLGTEVKNNGFRLLKACLCGMLAGVDTLKFMFVSRSHPTTLDKYTALGSVTVKSNDLFKQVGGNAETSWGIAKAFVELIKQQNGEKYVLVKDPNKTRLSLYCTDEVEAPEMKFDVEL